MCEARFFLPPVTRFHAIGRPETQLSCAGVLQCGKGARQLARLGHVADIPDRNPFRHPVAHNVFVQPCGLGAAIELAVPGPKQPAVVHLPVVDPDPVGYIARRDPGAHLDIVEAAHEAVSGDGGSEYASTFRPTSDPR